MLPRLSTYALEELIFACLNVRSLHDKVDDFLETLIVVRCSVCWRCASICVRFLRESGFQVFDRPCPHPSLQLGTVSMNHGGILFAVIPGLVSPLSPPQQQRLLRPQRLRQCMFMCQLVRTEI